MEAKTNKKIKKISSNIKLFGGADESLVMLSDKQGENNELRRFAMKAYTGQPVDTAMGKMIIDLKGMKIGTQRKPIFRDHNRGMIVGHTDKIKKVDGEGLHIEGVLHEDTEASKEIASKADAGFPWQASVGISINKIIELDSNSADEINGIAVTGPMLVVKSSTLSESSIVPLGADNNTETIVLSDNTNDEFLEIEMEVRDMADETIEKIKLEAQADSAKLLADLKTAYPDRLDFVFAQFEKGNDLTKAELEYAKLLRVELADAKTKIAGLEKQNVELSDKAAKAAAAMDMGADPIKHGADTKPADKPSDNPRKEAIIAAKKEYELAKANQDKTGIVSFGMKTCVDGVLRGKGLGGLSKEECGEYQLTD